jgi:transcriptional regulator with XRE-family HTH domain
VTDGKTQTAASRFAANVRARRELRGWSQRQLARALVDLGHPTFRQQTVAEIEAGDRAVKLDEALALSSALGISVDSLIRPAGLARQASELLDAAWAAREAGRQAAHWTAEHHAAQQRLARLLKAAGSYETELADEVAIARRALAQPAPAAG